MHRTSLIELLNSYFPSDEEIKTKQQIIKFVSSEPNCFERGLLKGHLTGSAWLVNRSKNKVLLTHHKKLDRWLQLGGHADGDPDVAAVALREAQEESGIIGIEPLSGNIFDLDIHLIPHFNGVPKHYHYDLRFAFIAPTDNFSRSETESKELAWVMIESVVEPQFEQSLVRMANKWLAR